MYKPGETELQTKEFYYDGVRRVQEHITRPLGVFTPFALGGDLLLGGAENDELAVGMADGSEPAQQILGGGGIGGGGGGVGGDPLPTDEQWLDREYVYGPGYVDEFVVQIDKDDHGIYMHQDANYNVVALTADTNHPDGQGGTLTSGALLEQYTYEPYGGVLTAESFYDHAVNRVGHQGLFFERYDGTSFRQTLASTENGLYYNRNRFYDPYLGRFIQRDPNETGIPIINALATNGQALSIVTNGFDAETLYTSGMNLYQFAGSNPVNHRDPVGLWDDYDEAIGAHQADLFRGWVTAKHAVAIAARGANLIELYTHMAFAWDDLVWDLNEDALFSLALGGFGARACFEAGTPVLLEDGTFATIETLEVGTPVASRADGSDANTSETEIVPSLWCVVRLHGEDAMDGEMEVVLLRPVTWLTATGADIGNSLELDIPDVGIKGSARVESIEPCPSHLRGSADGRVTGTFAREDVQTLLLFLDPSQEPIRTTPGHPFYSIDRDAWLQAGELNPGERLRTATGATTVRALELQECTARVFNLEIQGTHTYFVSRARVWVHNGCVKPDWVKNADNFCSWTQQLQDAAKAAARAGTTVARLTAEEARDLVALARKYGVKVTKDPPHPGQGAPWDTMSHLHFGDGRFHVPCPDDFVP